MNTDALSGRHCQARPLRPPPKRTWACNLLQGPSVAAPFSVVYVFVAAARVPHPAGSRVRVLSTPSRDLSFRGELATRNLLFLTLLRTIWEFALRILRRTSTNATPEIRLKTRPQSVAPPRDLAQPGHQLVRTRPHHHHPDPCQSRASRRRKNDHLRQARHTAIAPSGRRLPHDARRHQKTLQRNRAQVRRPRRRLHPHHLRRQPRRRRRQSRHPRTRRLRIQEKRKERKRKNQERRTSRSRQLTHFADPTYSFVR